MKRVAAAAVLGAVLLLPMGARGERARAADPCAPPDIAKPKATLSTPAKLDVAPGSLPVAPAVLDLGARPTPIDIFFVLDSSPSMDPVFESLKSSITKAGDDLRATGIDIWAGAADFSDLTNRPYRRDVALGPLDCRMVEGLAGVTTGGGGDEDHRLALEQAVAGTGRPEVKIEPGRGAAWRPGTLRLVLHASDTGIDESLDYSPTHEQLIKFFLERNVHHVGIHVISEFLAPTPIAGEENSMRAEPDMQRLSRDTKTLAPAGGLDCNGDGIPDLLAGNPVVCPFIIGQLGDVVSASMGTIVKQVVRTLRSTTGVELAVLDSGGLPVTITRPVRDVDLANPARLAYDFSAACPAPMLGHDVPVRFAARIAGETVAESTTLVTCIAAPAAAAAVRPPVAFAAAQAPAPSAVAPSSALQGAGQASVPAGAPANAPAFGIAVAPEDQLQVARAGAGSGGDEGKGTRVAGALMAIGVAGALRRRSALARQRRR